MSRAQAWLKLAGAALLGATPLVSVHAQGSPTPVLQGRVEKCDHIEARRVQLEVHACVLKAQDAKRETLDAAEQKRRGADAQCKGQSICRQKNRLERDTTARDAQQTYQQRAASCRKQQTHYYDSCRQHASERRGSSSSAHGGPDPRTGNDDKRLAPPIAGATPPTAATETHRAPSTPKSDSAPGQQGSVIDLGAASGQRGSDASTPPAPAKK